MYNALIANWQSAKQKENCNFNLNKQKVPKCENSNGYKYTMSGY